MEEEAQLATPVSHRRAKKAPEALSSEQAQRLLLYAADIGVSAAQAITQLDAAPDREDALKGAGLVVLVLLALTGEQRPRDLGSRFGLNSANTARLLDRLESAGYVERAWGRVAGDRRAILVALTEEGRRLAQDIGASLAGLLPSPAVLRARVTRLIDAPVPPPSGRGERAV